MLAAPHKTFISHSLEETRAFGRRLAHLLKSGDLLALHGELGTGKTTLAKTILSTLTTLPENAIQSPTFTYLQIYETSHFPLCHFDLYRLTSSEDFVKRGFLDYLEKPYVCLIEWPSKIKDLLPPDSLCLLLSHLENRQRQFQECLWKEALCL
ncbi:MAG: tRNA (adenosine(37)-N6)-threonylcarbamoyltransferase complex ATPase subunit type 1 TsaE [Chlamydiae bacterium]|nr:tRNA (adenosine(37)-N6)-threonylcarbamoyltransferase complex ATPase subunit type 1 TsaE [Chlamydiota bacterium]